MRIKAEHICHTYRSKHLVCDVLRDANLEIAPGETAGLLGSSGCGKTTLGQILCGLLKPSSGTVYYDGRPLTPPYKGEARREIQALFQHPEQSFNPRLTIRDSLKEIYRLFRLPYSPEILIEMLAPFGIYEEHLGRYPPQLSGGELQRVAIARVLLAKPRFLVLDEPTSMLDTITQAQIINMLRRLKDNDVSCLFITHNTKLCKIMSDKVFEMSNKAITVKNLTGGH
jgi:peptide/nickel transport system ATP-binding protein